MTNCPSRDIPTSFCASVPPWLAAARFQERRIACHPSGSLSPEEGAAPEFDEPGSRLNFGLRSCAGRRFGMLYNPLQPVIMSAMHARDSLG